MTSLSTRLRLGACVALLTMTGCAGNNTPDVVPADVPTAGDVVDVPPTPMDVPPTPMDTATDTPPTPMDAATDTPPTPWTQGSLRRLMSL